MSQVEIVNAESLVVGPDEVLIIRIPEDLVYYEDDNPEFVPFPQHVASELARLGLSDRSLVITGDVELAKIAR